MRLRMVMAAGVLAFAAGLAPVAVRADSFPSLTRAVEGLAPLPSRRALDRIPNMGRKLLALRSYLRSASRIADIWSWDETQIATFDGTPQRAALMAEIGAIGAHFAAANPGYGLYVNPHIRSLDDQIAAWNGNTTVGRAANQLYENFLVVFSKDGTFPQTIDADAFSGWLRRFMPRTPAPLAAPGLSAHGRASAIDFQIAQDGRVIAPADTSKIEDVWKKDGWDEKLKVSIEAAGPSFAGPLASPYEPWHYDYRPATGMPDLKPADPGPAVAE